MPPLNMTVLATLAVVHPPWVWKQHNMGYFKTDMGGKTKPILYHDITTNP